MPRLFIVPGIEKEKKMDGRQLDAAEEASTRYRADYESS